MNTLKKKIEFLIKEDQHNISRYFKRELTKGKYVACSKHLSTEFISILKSNYFPYRDSATKKLYESVITLSLHVDLKNLRRIYNKYIKVSTDKQVLPEHKILFIDKVRIISGRPQLYGSQYKIVNNKIKLLPIKDPEKLEQRRKEIGVENLSQYLKRVKL
jgi:hypothetical protein